MLMEKDNRDRALDSEYAVRRIFPVPGCWRPPPEGRMTSQAFADRSGEPSIDLYPSLTDKDCNEIKSDNAASLEAGFGLANAQVSEIRNMMVEKKFEGDVVRDPIDGNSKHGVISGKLTDGKKKVLSKLFTLCVKPDLDRYFAVQRTKGRS